MADRASVFETTQLGVEASGAAGTAVAALKKLSALMIEAGVKVDTKTYRGSGGKFPVVTTYNGEWTEAKVSGPTTYDEVVYPLSSIFGRATPTAASTTLAWQWVFDIAQSMADDIATFTIEQGSNVRALRYVYAFFTEFGIKWDRNGVENTGAILGQKVSDDVQMSTNETQTLAITGGPTGGTFTLTYAGQTTAAIAYNAAAAAVQSALEALSNIAVGDVVCTGGALPATAVVIEFRGSLRQTNVALITTDDALLTGGTTPSADVTQTLAGAAPESLGLVPLVPVHTTIRLADAQGDLGAASNLLRVSSVDWNLSDRFSAIWALNADNNGTFAAHVEIEPKTRVQLTMEADAAGMSPLPWLRNGTTHFIRIKNEGATIEETAKYTFQLDMAFQVTETSELKDTDGVVGITWTLTGVYDATWGKTLRITVINTVDAI